MLLVVCLAPALAQGDVTNGLLGLLMEILRILLKFLSGGRNLASFTTPSPTDKPVPSPLPSIHLASAREIVARFFVMGDTPYQIDPER